TLEAAELRLLAKALRPLPEKWHGLQDVETRYRQRYLDLIVNPDARRIFEVRARAVRYLRDFLVARGYLEVETPMMRPLPGGAAARPFVTHHNALDVDLYLRIAPELYLKRLVVAGYDRVYELNRTFRNEGMSTQHNPEFTMLEFYQAYADVGDLMELTETLLLHLAQTLPGRTRMTYQEHELDLTPPWRRLPFFAALTQALGAGVGPETPGRRLRELGAARGVELAAAAERWEAWPELFESLVEPTLVQPTFVVDFPVELSPLSKRKRDDPRLV